MAEAALRIAELADVEGQPVACDWGPPMSVYTQTVGKSPEGLVAVSQRALTAITKLCDGLYGPVA